MYRLIIYGFLSTCVTIGFVTGMVGLYRFRTVSTRVHVCSAAATWITWSVAAFGLVYAENTWVRCAMIVYWLVRAFLLPLGSQLWIAVEKNHNTNDK